VADLPKLKAAVATGDAPTVQPLADEYREEMKADLLVLSDPSGATLAQSGAPAIALPAAVGETPPTEELAAFSSQPQGLTQIISVPILIEGDLPEILGRMTVGFFFDDALASRWQQLTGSEIAFGTGDRILAASLPRDRQVGLAALLPRRDITAVRLGDEDFIATARPLQPQADAADGPAVLILRSRTERLRFLSTIRMGLLAALVVTLFLATLVSYALARTVARPLSAITGAMREVAATGDLTRKVALRSGRWDDADARVLASTFNTLTESIAGFEKEARQKDRLSSLGRLSTVIAHEIRNPLMIIKASLLSLQEHASPEERREAVIDIEEETNRLNRIVTDVLDFAKPLQFDLADTDLNDVCRDSAYAAWAGRYEEQLCLDLDEALPPVFVDRERLRMALVNLLANARHAVDGSDLRGSVTMTTARVDGRAAVLIRDRGVGIAPEDLAHIFDPYFTTRRAGTGLGLPIARNIIEGMGGTIAIQSTQGAGTEIRVDLPLAPTEAHS
jgi:signal transduction histidine kinase